MSSSTVWSFKKDKTGIFSKKNVSTNIEIFFSRRLDERSKEKKLSWTKSGFLKKRKNFKLCLDFWKTRFFVIGVFFESGQFANRNRNRNRTGPVNCRLAVCLSFKIFFWAKGRNEPRSVHFGDLSSTPTLQKNFSVSRTKRAVFAFLLTLSSFPERGEKEKELGKMAKGTREGKSPSSVFYIRPRRSFSWRQRTKGFSCNERRRGK